MDKWRDDIEKYLNGKLTPAERHALEKKALSDPFLADALEGAETLPNDYFTADVDHLNQQILGEKKNRWLWPLRIAASVIGIVVISTVVIYTTSDSTENLASTEARKKDQVPTESKTDSINQSLAQSGDSDQEAKQNKAEEKSEKLIAGLKEEKPKRKEATDKPETAREQDKGFAETQSLAGAGGTQSGKPTQDQNVSGPVVAKDTISATGLASVTTTTAPITLSAEDKFADDGVKTESALPKVAKGEGRLKRASGLISNTTLVNGIVRDQQGQPIPGVNIVAKGSTNGTTTNTEGKYSIEVTDKDQVLEYSFIGYVSQEQPVEKSKAANLDVNLSEDVTQLSEVVVTGYGQKRDSDEPVVKLAEPLGGRKAYDKYLEEKKIYPQQALNNKVEGRVIIEFTVGTTGVLSDFSVVKKLGYGCEEEVIRLVREGPQWKPSYIDNEPVESLVRIKTRFELPGR